MKLQFTKKIDDKSLRKYLRKYRGAKNPKFKKLYRDYLVLYVYSETIHLLNSKQTQHLFTKEYHNLFNYFDFEDLAQDVVIKFIIKLDRPFIHKAKKPKDYFFLLIRNAIIDQLRIYWREKEFVYYEKNNDPDRPIERFKDAVGLSPENIYRYRYFNTDLQDIEDERWLRHQLLKYKPSSNPFRLVNKNIQNIVDICKNSIYIDKQIESKDIYRMKIRYPMIRLREMQRIFEFYLSDIRNYLQGRYFE